jgi:nucleoside-diphosphate-sugar epimerase
VRIFLAGASGVIGTALVPLLVAGGHELAGMTRSAGKAGMLRDLGAEPVVCDVYEATALTDAVRAFSPEMVMHQLTDLPDEIGRIPFYMRRNNRIRGEGTRNLIEAASAAEVPRFLAQSIAFKPPGVGRVILEHERMVLDFGGVVLRYGMFYGPGTFTGERRLPGPRIRVEEAARRTVELLDAPGGVYTLVEQ